MVVVILGFKKLTAYKSSKNSLFFYCVIQALVRELQSPKGGQEQLHFVEYFRN